MNKSTVREGDSPIVADAMRLMDEAFTEANKPIDIVLHCPACGRQHIDEPEPVALLNGRPSDRWTNPPHRSRLCHGCGHIWRPADVPTNGVAAVKTYGKADSAIVMTHNAQFNAAIDFAIDQGVEASTFLTSWREGDTSEWPEFNGDSVIVKR